LGQTAAIKAEFLRTARDFPEFLPSKTDDLFVLGGFAALGNPSSFHNMCVRQLREWAMSALLTQVFQPYVRAYCPAPATVRLEQIWDRMLIRVPAANVTGEAWHRDVAKRTEAEDVVFGGWLNLDATPQYFCCAPGSAAKFAGEEGFYKIPKAELAGWDKQKRMIEIPPGFILIFNETLVHTVLPSAKSKRADPDPNCRLFLGWRLTQSVHPLLPIVSNTTPEEYVEQVMAKQAAPLLKSGQGTAMYAQLHWTNWRDQIETFSEGLHDVCKEYIEVRSGDHQGEVRHIVARYMSNLEDYGLPMYPAYTEAEKTMHYPHQHWALRPPPPAPQLPVALTLLGF
jgi:hypothetical protein